MSDISTKLTYLNTTKQLLKTEINKINNVLDDNSTFRSYPQELFNGYLDVLNNGTDTLWNNLEKVSQTGTEAVLEGVETAPMKMVLNGNTSQETTSGNNLLDTNNISHTSTSTNLTINSNENGEITINGEHIANVTLKSSLSTPLSGTYTLIFKKISGNISNNDINFRYAIGNAENGSAASPNGRLLTNIFNGDSNIVVSTGNINDTMEKFHIYFNAGATFNNYKFVIYLVQGTYTSENIPDYEPYTGGQPSPSPDFPQEVKVVKGENVVSVQGKNLLDISYLVEANADKTYVSQGFWAFKLSDKIGTYTLSRENANMVSGGSYIAWGEGNDITTAYNRKTWIAHQSQPTLNNKKQTKTNSGELWLFLSINETRIQNIPNDYGYLMLELGSTATDFVPYSKTDYPINLGTLELCKIGDYKDYLFKRNGKWYKHKVINKVVLDGSESWLQSSVRANVHNIRLNDMLPPTTNAEIYINGISNAFLNGASYNNLTAVTTYMNYYNRMSATSDKYMSFSYEFTTSINDWKAWLSTHNTIVYYVLATPTEEEITNTTLIEQLEAIYKAKSVKDKTYITQTNDELPFILDVSAIKEYEVN